MICLCAKWLQCHVPAERDTEDKQTNSPKEVPRTEDPRYWGWDTAGDWVGIVLRCGVQKRWDSQITFQWTGTEMITIAPHPWPEREGRRGGMCAVSGEAKSETGEQKAQSSAGVKKRRLNADWPVSSSLQPHSAPGHRYSFESPPCFSSGEQRIPLWRNWAHPEDPPVRSAGLHVGRLSPHRDSKELFS